MQLKIKRPLWPIGLSIFILLFGTMTIFKGWSVLFTEIGRTKAGNFVPFVLWYNFTAGFFYLLAGIALIKHITCAKRLAALIASTSAIVYLLLLVHIIYGGLYETRTVVAMSFRTFFWISVATVAFKAKALNTIKCKY